MTKEHTGLTKKHFVAFDTITRVQATLTAYGKLIEGGESTPSALGISHPQGIVAPLHKSLVYGVQLAGRCIRLPQPQEVALPAPDGPADGCGWDASEFVVWKNLPRDWVTLHFQSQPKPLINALSEGMGKPAKRLMATAMLTTDIGAQVKSIVQTWANMQSEPAGTAVLQLLWANSGISGPFAFGAQKLAQDLNSQLGSSILGTDITATMTVDQLIQML